MRDEVFRATGIFWDVSGVEFPATASSVERVAKRYLKSLPQFVWEAAQLESNPFTFPEVQTLLDGVTVGGRKLSDAQQILALRDSMKMLSACVRDQSFAVTKEMACALNGVIASDEALEWGMFRGEGHEISNVTVNLGAESWRPRPTVRGARELTETFAGGTVALEKIENPIERAFALKLFMSREQFFFDGNKRTARAMMNGVLMSHGYDGISIPFAKQLHYNQAMTRFYPSGDATEMMRLLASCFPE
jgi:Fic family protein